MILLCFSPRRAHDNGQHEHWAGVCVRAAALLSANLDTADRIDNAGSCQRYDYLTVRVCVCVGAVMCVWMWVFVRKDGIQAHSHALECYLKSVRGAYASARRAHPNPASPYLQMLYINTIWVCTSPFTEACVADRGFMPCREEAMRKFIGGASASFDLNTATWLSGV